MQSQVRVSSKLTCQNNFKGKTAAKKIKMSKCLFLVV